ncbi:hypothetical protein L484_022735 [Morus notabilis]|uniref:Uncharacterized protein n=1 Tax=Morus notabilis TaxID=981085 RepID=W9SK75_9ROSA|nr:hypothetical protein L484_022735 [Morus notabilis]
MANILYWLVNLCTWEKEPSIRQKPSQVAPCTWEKEPSITSDHILITVICNNPPRLAQINGGSHHQHWSKNSPFFIGGFTQLSVFNA